MAGKIRKMIDTIIAQRSHGDPTIAQTTQIKLIMKGVDPDRYGPTSPDDTEMIEKLKLIGKELGVNL
jgi:hypothetical protein